MDDETETELYYAIDKNQPEKIEKLLKNGLDPNVVFNGYDHMGKTWYWAPLHFCCEKGREECARLLLQYGADTEIGDRWCMTPLMYAVRTEWHNMVQVMLDHPTCNINCQDTRGRTPVHIATECSDDICLKMLCDAGADVDIQDLVGRTPVWQTVTSDGRRDHLKRLLERKCQVNIQDGRDKRIPLQEAIIYSYEDSLHYVIQLLEAGSDVNHRDEANLNSMLNLLVKLMRNGKDASDDEVNIATRLIDAGYKLNAKAERTSWHKYGGGVLHKAAELDSVRLISLFLNRGAYPDIIDDSGVTPLLCSMTKDHTNCAVQLLRHNCHPDLAGEIKHNLVANFRPPNSTPIQTDFPSSPGSPLAPMTCVVTPMQCALSRGNVAAVYWLVNHGSVYQPRDLLELLNECQEEVEVMMELRSHMVADLVNRAFGVRSLFEMCIFKFRRSIGVDIKTILSTLCLPAFIKNQILLEYLYDHDDSN